MFARRCLLSALVGALLGTAEAGPVPTPDPWPSVPVLTRLFRLPTGRPQAEQLIRALDLTVAQVRELRRLAGSETLHAARPPGPENQARIGAVRQEKDRKVRMVLGADYSVFRRWVRAWWLEQLRQAAADLSPG